MTPTPHYKIRDQFGALPTQVITGENPDGDKRYMLSHSYTFQGETRRRTWLTLRQLQEVFRRTGEFLYGVEAMETALAMLEEAKASEVAGADSAGSDTKPSFLD